MAITIPAPDPAAAGAPLSARLTPPQIWGIVLLTPYLLVFLAFVLYPVCYGLWLAREPSSYVALYHDPIFARAAVNTLIFLVIGINLKMLAALFLSGFFVQERRWIRWLSVVFILPWAVPSIPTILSVRFMLNPEWGMINQLIFRFTGGTTPFDFTKNWKFTILNSENVWAKAMNRVVSEKVPVDKAVDELIARIKQVAG